MRHSIRESRTTCPAGRFGASLRHPRAGRALFAANFVIFGAARSSHTQKYAPGGGPFMPRRQDMRGEALPRLSSKIAAAGSPHCHKNPGDLSVATAEKLRSGDIAIAPREKQRGVVRYALSIESRRNREGRCRILDRQSLPYSLGCLFSV